MSEILRGIYTKIVHRHPHVFEDLKLEESQDVIVNWEKIKADERAEKGKEKKGLLAGVPLSLPALTQAQTFQKRAARVGFDWSEVEGVVEKIQEELKELDAADQPRAQESELGDVLFAVVNLARWLGIDAESALRTANERFKARFLFLEQKAHERGRELSDFPMEELDVLWEEVKKDRLP